MRGSCLLLQKRDDVALLLGAIADDFTGATDLANTLVRGGMRTIQTIGVPEPDAPLGDADAIVVALKSRSIPADEAVRLSLEALDALLARGASKFIFKYCSTFDSTDHGNIGPVADALLERLGSDVTVFCPAFPENGRRIFNGYLFVNDVLLSESGMEKHPITPMTDSNLVRVLGRQTKHKVGKIDLARVRRGEAAVRTAIMEARAQGVRHLVVDAAGDEDLHAIGLGTEELPLITGGSGIAIGLPTLFVRLGMLERGPGVDALPHVDGPAVVLSGSCSRATLAQVEYMRARRPSFSIDTTALDRPDGLVESALTWAGDHLRDAPILISASAPPENVAQTQARFGKERAGEQIEHVFGTIAHELRARGVRRFVVAGGETSGAVVRELGVRALRIGRQIDPGVPWTETVGSPAIALALKSGNFGSEDFFLRAIELAP